MKCNPRYLRKAKGRKRDANLHILYNPPKSVRNFKQFAEKTAVLYNLIEHTDRHCYYAIISNYSSNELLNYAFTIYTNAFYGSYGRPLILKQSFIPNTYRYTITFKQVTLDYYEVILLSQFVNT